MARPTRKHPLLRHHRSGEVAALIAHVVRVIGGFDYRAVEQAGSVTVCRLDGPSGSGLMGDRMRPVGEPPGVTVTLVSAWVRGAGQPGGWLLDARFHGWDARVLFAQTGDRSVLDLPRERRNRVRDERAQEAARRDSLTIADVPAGVVPLFTAGLTSARVRELAVRHAPELLAPR